MADLYAKIFGPDRLEVYFDLSPCPEEHASVTKASHRGVEHKPVLLRRET
jgi:hypothetical protein